MRCGGGALFSQNGTILISDLMQVGTTDTYTAEVTYNNGPGPTFTPVNISVTVEVNGSVSSLTQFAPNGGGWGATSLGPNLARFNGGVIAQNWNSAPNADNLIGTISFVPASTECFTVSSSAAFFVASPGFRFPDNATSNEKCFVYGEVKLAATNDALNSRVVRLRDGLSFVQLKFIGDGQGNTFLFDRDGIADPNFDAVLFSNQPKFNGNVNVQDVNGIIGNILGINSFTEPFQMVAADVNQDQVVDIGDLVAIQRGLLGISEDDMENAWYHPTEASLNSTVSFGDGPVIFTEQYTAADIQAGGILDVVAVKSGDVVVDPIFGQDYDKSITGDGLLIVEDASIGKDELVDVPVYLSNVEEFNVLALALSYNSQNLDFVDIISGALSLNSNDNYLIDIDEEKVSIMTNLLENNVSLKTDEPLFFLRLRAKQQLDNLKKSIKIIDGERSQVVSAGLGKSKVNQKDILLQWAEPTNKEVTLFAKVLSANPFREELTVSINVDVNAAVALRLFDLNGRVVGTLERKLLKGATIIDLSEMVAPAPPGAYVLSVSTGIGQQFTAKVIKQ